MLRVLLLLFLFLSPFLFADEGYTVSRLKFKGDLPLPLDTIEVGETPLVSYLDGFEPKSISAQEIVEISESVVQHYNHKGIIGVSVSVDPQDIDENGYDLRKKGNNTLNFQVKLAKIHKIQSIALGDRFSGPNKQNLPQHAFLLVNAPAKELGGAIHKNLLDDYTHRLNRHPSRTVNIQLTGTSEEEGVNLDFLVKENRPMRAYYDISSRGTKGTREWLQRFGILHYQLTGKDDIFSLEYVTAAFRHVHSVTASYDRPIGQERIAHLILRGHWSEFIASQFGLFDDEFEGRQSSASLEFNKNIWQNKDFFCDLYTSCLWRQIATHMRLVGLTSKAEESFLIPSVGIRYSKNGREEKIFGSFSIEGNASDLAQTRPDRLSQLGRITKDDSFFIFRAQHKHSKYFSATSQHNLQKNEFFYDLRGSFSMKYRLIPQMQSVLGGIDSIRGYPQANVSADSMIRARSEIRRHEQPFKDTYLQGHLFLDYGRAWINRALSFEKNKSLLGTGVGLSFAVKEQIKLSADYGVALKKVETASYKISPGHQQFYSSLTILY